MAEKVEYTCDVCGVTKKATNHWWVIRASEGLFRIATWEYATYNWGPDEFGQVHHLCGEGCATRKLAEFFGTPTGGA